MGASGVPTYLDVVVRVPSTVLTNPGEAAGFVSSTVSRALVAVGELDPVAVVFRNAAGVAVEWVAGEGLEAGPVEWPDGRS